MYMRIIDKKSALKVFYYLMSIDGQVTENELVRFEEIGKEFDETFFSYKDELVKGCEEYISTADNVDRYDIIQEGLDESLRAEAVSLEDGVPPRLLVWDMLTLSYSDGGYSGDEKRLINHVGRILKVEASVMLEMNQLIATAMSIEDELVVLNQSNKPYSEIRPVVDEMEKRKKVILDSAKDLLEDEVIFYTPEKQEKTNKLSELGNKINEKVAPKAAELGNKFNEKVVPKASELGEKSQKALGVAAKGIGKAASKGAEGFKAGASKLFAKKKTQNSQSANSVEMEQIETTDENNVDK